MHIVNVIIIMTNCAWYLVHCRYLINVSFFSPCCHGSTHWIIFHVHVLSLIYIIKSNQLRAKEMHWDSSLVDNVGNINALSRNSLGMRLCTLYVKRRELHNSQWYRLSSIITKTQFSILRCRQSGIHRSVCPDKGWKDYPWHQNNYLQIPSTEEKASELSEDCLFGGVISLSF